ncbi:serine/threonine-protein kinase [Nocardia sp. NBC_01327]|uniref:serine/threonine-protein kinase n=1 Tax=Nocardia sp. NBC_01327 TaxID=2903593 RepID=UPI002E153604|nr:protein kinase [Nocardia sp. NBC_01327]
MGGHVPGEATLGHYRLRKLLGRGGMGQVWLAEDTRMGRDVALKVLPPELVEDEGYQRRFQREGRLAARLRGPHIVPIHNFGELDGRLFIDMELVDGFDLGRTLEADGALSPTAAVDVVAQVAEALDVAHAAGLIHRDVKPSNVLMLESGFAYLIDFGIARGVGSTTLTAVGAAIGTWSYMAPERFSGAEDLRSDVYSLACVLFECLTGNRPYGNTSPPQQMAAHLTAPAPRASAHNPAVPTALDKVIACGMEKDPGQRYASAGALAAAARAAVSPPSAPPPNISAPRASPTVRWGTSEGYPRVESGAPQAGYAQPQQGYAPQWQGEVPQWQGEMPPRHVYATSYQSAPSHQVQPPMAQGYSPVGQGYPAATPDYRSAPAQGYTAQGYGSTSAPQPASYPPYSPAAQYTSERLTSSAATDSGKPGISLRRGLWWIVLCVLILFFGMLVVAGFAVYFSDDKFGWTGLLVAALIFDLPFGIFVYLFVKDIKKFRRR